MKDNTKNILFGIILFLGVLLSIIFILINIITQISSDKDFDDCLNCNPNVLDHTFSKYHLMSIILTTIILGLLILMLLGLAKTIKCSSQNNS